MQQKTISYVSPSANKDDIHVIANAFLERHKLPLAYLEQLITFIDQVGPK